MSETKKLILVPDPRCRSQEAGVFLAQLEDLHADLAQALDGASPEELGWQPHPGANTIAMLVTHIAIAQVHLTDIGVRLLDKSDVAAVLGLDEMGDGMPLASGASPPASLAGRGREELLALLAKAREHAVHFVAALAEPDLDRRTKRHPAGRAEYEFNVRWMLHHLQEHLAGHLGQVQLLRAAYRQQHAPAKI